MLRLLLRVLRLVISPLLCFLLRLMFSLPNCISLVHSLVSRPNIEPLRREWGSNTIPV